MFGHFIALRKAAEISRTLQIVVSVAAIGLFGASGAQAASTTVVTTGTPVAPAVLAATPAPAGTPPVSTDSKTTVGNVDWGGLNWGVGIATDFDVRGTRVNTAQIVGTPGIVRVDSTASNANVGFVLEMHYFLRDFTWQSSSYVKAQGACVLICNLDVATGPFVAIEVGNGTSAQPGADKLITGYALGWMVGLHHLKPADNNPNVLQSVDNRSWNFGVGLRIDPSAQVLGDGFIANQPPPAGETGVRFKTEPRLGIMLLSSFTFN
jgi:hypothetical protein